jgi:hypothetical protein
VRILAIASRSRRAGIRPIEASKAVVCYVRNTSIRDILKRLKCANSGHSRTTWRTGKIDPECAFGIEPMKGRYGRGNSLRAEASVAPVRPPLRAHAGRPPAGPGWQHEVKRDGWRMLAYKQANGPHILLLYRFLPRGDDPSFPQV